MPVSQAKLLEGKGLAVQMQEMIRAKIAGYLEQGFPRPRMTVVQVGENPASAWYVGQQQKLAAKIGVEFEKNEPGEITHMTALLKKMEAVSRDPALHGIFLTMPLPESFNADQALEKMDLHKDVEGIHPANLGLMVLRKGRLIPPTAYAAYRLIEASGISLRGKRAVLVGQSAIVGRPLQMLLGDQRVTTTVCNSATSITDLEKIVSESDIVIGCCGQPRMIRGNWIRPGAVVIDVGTTEVDGKLIGDVEFEAASERAAFITPVPGGVGPLTVTMLMQNLLHAYEWQIAHG
jgi:methylenetetrahydrofolate dehydrogenase (NADP+) / methenyltetrahydrofolate cyclohydrolase